MAKSIYDTAYANPYPDLLEPNPALAKVQASNNALTASPYPIGGYGATAGDDDDMPGTGDGPGGGSPLPPGTTVPPPPYELPTPRSYRVPKSVTQQLLEATYRPSQYPGYRVSNGELTWGGTGAAPDDPQMQAVADYLTDLGTPLDTQNYQGFFQRLYGQRAPSSATLSNADLAMILQAGGVKLGRPNVAGLVDSVILPSGQEVDVGYAFSANDPSQMRWTWNPITGQAEPTSGAGTGTTLPANWAEGYGPLVEPWTTPFEPPGGESGPLENAPAYIPPAIPEITPWTAPTSTPFREFDAPTSEPFREFDAPTSDPFREFDWTQQWRPTTGADVYADPSYAFRRDEGLGAMENRASARSFLRNTNTMRDFVNYGSNLASTEFGNIDTRRRRDYDTAFGQSLADYETDRGTYFGNRDRAFGEALSDYGADRDTYYGNRDRAFDEAVGDYELDRGTYYGNRDRAYNESRGEYDTNIGNLLARSDREQNRAAGMYAPQLLNWQTQIQDRRGREDERYARAWQLYQNEIANFKANQGTLRDQLRWQTEFGAGVA